MGNAMASLGRESRFQIVWGLFISSAAGVAWARAVRETEATCDVFFKMQVFDELLNICET